MENEVKKDNILGQRIRELRLGKGMSQSTLAELLKKATYTPVTKWESGTNSPSARQLSSIADVLETNTDYLLGRIDFSAPLQMDEGFLEIYNSYNQIEDDGKKKQIRESIHDRNYEQDLVTNHELKKVQDFYNHQNKLDYFSVTVNGELDGESVTLYEEPETLLQKGSPAPYDVSLFVKGDALLPFYEDGEIVYLRKGTIKDGEIALFEHNGKLVFAKLRLGSRPKLVLFGKEPKEIKLELTDSLSPIGKVSR